MNKSDKDISCKHCIARQAFIDAVVQLATLEHEEAKKKADALGLRRDL